jgi:hypothetical protein
MNKTNVLIWSCVILQNRWTVGWGVFFVPSHERRSVDRRNICAVPVGSASKLHSDLNMGILLFKPFPRQSSDENETRDTSDRHISSPYGEKRGLSGFMMVMQHTLNAWSCNAEQMRINKVMWFRVWNELIDFKLTHSHTTTRPPWSIPGNGRGGLIPKRHFLSGQWLRKFVRMAPGLPEISQNSSGFQIWPFFPPKNVWTTGSGLNHCWNSILK